MRGLRRETWFPMSIIRMRLKISLIGRILILGIATDQISRLPVSSANSCIAL